MNDLRPGVTIILTSYNYARFLPRAIASAQSQVIDNLEILILDNASTDNSWALIENAAAKDSRIVAVRNEANLGMVGNHARGLELARGTRVLFLSADDYLLPGHIARVLAIHAEHPEIDAVFSTYAQVDEHDRFIRFMGHAGHLRGSYSGGRNEFAGLLTHDCYMCLPTTLLDRAELLAGGGFDPEIRASDYELYVRMARAGRRFAFLAQPGVAVRIHAGAASGEDQYVASGMQLLEHLHILERHLVSAVAPQIAGHENGIAQLLTAKINNLRAYPQIAASIMPQAQPRIDAAVLQLNSVASAVSARLPASQPVISVILHCSDDLSGDIGAISMLSEQTYKNHEVVIVADSSVELGPVLLDRARSLRTKYIRHTSPQSSAAAFNDALRLASGEIITYLQAGVTWPANHLEQLASHFCEQPMDAAIARADLVAVRNASRDASREIARFENFYGGGVAAGSAKFGEAVPLPTLAHRRCTVDRLGPFNETLRHLSGFEFALRLFSGGPISSYQGAPMVIQHDLDTTIPAVADPNGYLAELQAIYKAYPSDVATAQMREKHLQRLHGLLNRASSGDIAARFDFVRAARGTVDCASEVQRETRGRPRVLVIDDRVPYPELGRGYPRAMDLLNELRNSGAHVRFYPLQFPFDEDSHSAIPQGVEILYGRGEALLGATLEDMLPETDIVWVSRPHNMAAVRRALGDISPTRSWALVYDAEAVYAQREIVKAALAGSPLDLTAQATAIVRELQLTDGADLVVSVCAAERDLIAQRFSGPIEVLSFSLEAAPTEASFEDRSGLLFVGAIEAQSPNEDALRWFVDEVMRPQGVQAVWQVRHAGVMTSSALREAPREHVHFLGMVPNLREVYNAARIFIAPTRFAAGLPQKIYEAAANGLPIVASPLLAQQLGWQHERELLVAGSPVEWISQITRLNSDASLWHALRSSALKAIEREVSPTVFRDRVKGVLTIAKNARSGVSRS
ncbi:MAG: glycosyltransferase [Candidatus Baltobacteraceae bacterium]